MKYLRQAFADVRLQLNDQLRCLDSRLEAQQGQLVELQDIFRRRAEIELNYSRDLEKLGKLVTSRHKEQKTKREVNNLVILITLIFLLILLLVIKLIVIMIIFILSYGARSPQQRSGDNWLQRPGRPAGHCLRTSQRHHRHIFLHIVIIAI